MDNEMERNGTLTRERLMRWAGLFAMLGGILYIGIQVIHPEDSLASVDTSIWAIVAVLTSLMSLCNLIGIRGIYGSQVSETGWLGLIGSVLFSLFWLLALIFSFIEAFVLPMITSDAPQYVEGVVGIFTGGTSTVDLGLLPAIGTVAGLLYPLGGLLFGIAIFRAGVLPRMSGALLAFAAVITFAAAVIPHPFDRVLAVPMGAAFLWLGYALWSKRQRSTNS